MRVESWEEFVEKVKEQNPNWDGTLFFYVEGSQGVSPAEEHFNLNEYNGDIERMVRAGWAFVEENAWENIDSYLEDNDGDEDEALAEAVVDSGDKLIRSSSAFVAGQDDVIEIELDYLM
ncbi:MAG: hypothetical protein LIR50_11930 [Bacillota bacterium]|nr:hypothetical protein [Bacillota bacterium]